MTEYTTELLNVRETTHGDYPMTAGYAQSIKQILARAGYDRNKAGLPQLTAMQRESLDLIATKIARILAGDASFAEHWEDIAGYAKLPLGGK